MKEFEYQYLNQLHSKLVRLIINFGDKYDKKHGNLYVYFIDSTRFLLLDSWNKSINLREWVTDWFDCEYHASVSRVSIQLYNIGIDFGKFETNVGEEEYKFLIESIENYSLQKPNLFMSYNLEEVKEGDTIYIVDREPFIGMDPMPATARFGINLDYKNLDKLIFKNEQHAYKYVDNVRPMFSKHDLKQLLKYYFKLNTLTKFQFKKQIQQIDEIVEDLAKSPKDDLP